MTAQPQIQTDGATQLAEAVKKEAAGVIAVANAYQIDSADMAECAAEDMNAWAKRAKEIDNKRLELKRPLMDHMKLLDGMFNAPIDQLNKGVSVIKSKLLDWNKREAARVAAEKAEQEAERRRQEEAVRQQQAEVQEQIDEAIATGDVEALDELEGKAMTVEQATAAVLYAPPIATEKTSVSGASVRTTWKAEVTSIMELAQAVIDGRASANLLQPNMTEINRIAKALRAETKIPGVRVFEEQSIARTGR